MNNIPFSVLTIVKNRQEALQNLVSGLEKSVRMPAELVIVNMNEPASEVTSDQFPVRAFRFDAEEKLPLAAARNFAAQQAEYDFFVFLDVVCIPAPELTDKYFKANQQGEKLWIGPVRYLREVATTEADFLSKMHELSKPDPVRGDLSEVDYAFFWSLNFACSRATYQAIGGFDTRFKGYGGEDTDFGFAAREKAVPLGVVDAVAYHQYHPSYDPPFNHFDDILINTNTFREKWGIWPMGGWLRKFVAARLIEWNEHEIKVLRKPDEAMIRAALKR